MDGLRLECKNDMKAIRNNKRTMYGKKHSDCNNADDEEEDPAQLAVYMKYSSEIKRDHYYMFIDFLKHRGVKFMVAPYEADSQLAYMYHTGEIQYILTEDSDLVAYGCFNIIRCLKKNGDCKVLNAKKKLLKSAYPALRSFLALDDETRIKCCILAGCDYLPNIKGLGFASLIRLFDVDFDIMKSLKHYAVKTRKVMTSLEFNDFQEKFNNVFHAFTEQLVYCSAAEKIVNLSSSRTTRKISLKTLDTRFVGSPIPIERDFVAGRVDFDNLTKLRKACKIDFYRILKFFDYQPTIGSGRIGNLTTQLVTYDNFDKSMDYVSEKDLEKEPQIAKRTFYDRTIGLLGCKNSKISDKETVNTSSDQTALSILSECSKKIKDK